MIKIVDGWYFVPETNQYILIHEYEKAKGVFGKKGVDSGEMIVKHEEVGYFTSLQGMLRRLAQILVRDKVCNKEIKTIKEYISALESVESDLCEICKGY